MECAVRDLNVLIKSESKFHTIYADPPWPYGNQSTRAATSNHYNNLTMDDIRNLPIKDLVHDNAHLYLWTTNAFLFAAQSVIESWGFTYKSVLVWCKPQMGIGNYWRVCHEFLLFGLRGKLPLGDVRKTTKSWQIEPRQNHSAKPAYYRQLIEQASPEPRLELFARQLYTGWTSFGNQIEDTLWANTDPSTKPLK